MMKTPEPERPQWRLSGIFIGNFEHMSGLFFNVSVVDFEQLTACWVRLAASVSILTSEMITLSLSYNYVKLLAGKLCQKKL